MPRVAAVLALLALVACDEMDETIPTPCRQVVECSLDMPSTASARSYFNDDGTMASDNPCTQEVIRDLELDQWGKSRAKRGYADDQFVAAEIMLACLGLTREYEWECPEEDKQRHDETCNSPLATRYLDDGTPETYEIWPWED
jgi:hypothetical protein